MIKSISRKIKNIKYEKLFYNNKFIAFFSIVSSFVLWIVVSSSGAESVPVTISDIPVDITLSSNALQDGLRIFSGQDITARVEVTGSRMVVGQLTKNDIQVSAPQAASTIMSPGNYTLELSAKKVGLLKDYEIASDVKPSMITVMVDRYRESEFEIEPQINFNPKANYFVGNTVLSSPKVKISGPETEISKIKKVIVKKDVPGEISETINFKLPIILCDVYGQPITSETISINFPEVEVSIPVLMKKEVTINPNFSNLPRGLHLNKEIVKISPHKLEIAGPEDVLADVSSIQLPEVNFNSINMQNNKFNLPICLPQGCKSLNSVYHVDMEIDMSLFREKTLNINHFSLLNVPKDKSVKVYNGSINVNFLGLGKSIGALKSSDVVAQIDLEGKKDNINSMEMPVKLIVDSYNDVWVSEEYFVNVLAISKINTLKERNFNYNEKT